MTEIKIDLKDKQILFELDYNARIPLTQLAKKVRLSPQTTKYRIQQLEKKEIIKKYVTFFDVAKFGYLYYRLYIHLENTTIKKEQKILSYLEKHPNVVWLVSTNGRYDIEVLFVARNFIHFNSILKSLYEKFPGKLHNNTVSVSIENYHQRRGYLLNKQTDLQVTYGKEPTNEKIDELDKKIIRIINQNARLTNNEIGTRLNLNYKTIQSRIKKLEQKGIIIAYRTWINFEALGSSYHKYLIKLKNFDNEQKKEILFFCKSKPNIIYLVTTVWPWDIEIEIESSKEKESLEIMREFRELIGENILSYESLVVTKEHKLNYCPFAKSSLSN